MAHIRRGLMLFVAAATCVAAAEVRPGDRVRLIERDQHISAHQAADDTRAHLRFVSGAEATVLQVHPATGWIEVQGEPVQGYDCLERVSTWHHKCHKSLEQ